MLIMDFTKIDTTQISDDERVEDHQIDLFFRQTRKDGFERAATYFYTALASYVLHVEERPRAITCQPQQSLPAQALLSYRAAVV